MRTSAPALAPFFRSDLQARLLAALLLGTRDELSAADLRDRVGGSRSGLNQELQRLLDAGVIERRMVGRAALYRRAESSPLLEPLTMLVERTIGVEPELRRRLGEVSGVGAAAIYGSWAGGESLAPSSDVDVLVIGRPDRDQLERAARGVEQLAGREISLSVYDPDDWAERVATGSGFATTVLSRPLVPLVGSVPGAAE
jgi:predicted nucleotidyltransferase/biotin operon repressor